MSTQEFIHLFLKILPFLLPIFLIQLGLAIYALLDLKKRLVVHGPRWLWALILIITAFALPTGILASGIYLGLGRQTDEG